MEVREGCNFGGDSSIGRGGCIGGSTSGNYCQGLQTDGDPLRGAISQIYKVRVYKSKR